MATKFLFNESGIYLPEGIEPLGSGRYGEVWAVCSEIGNIRRAVKINSPEHHEVLQKEFETLKKLEKVDDDGLILRAYELGETDDQRPCMLMELLDAKPLQILAQELRRRVILPGSQQMKWSLEDEILRVRVATQVTNALYTAFKARVALTDLKIDNFYYDENWPQLVKVIDWNFVDIETPHAGFVNDTIPKLGDVFYEIFTGLSLREQQQEDRIGKINVDLFAKTRQDQTWPMFWDQITFGTREIIRAMVFSGFKGENQPLDLWSRWLARRRLLADKDGLDKVFAIETADLEGKLELTPDWEVMEAYSILRLIDKSEKREFRLREIIHRYIAGLVGERDFYRSDFLLLSARRLYAGSIRLDFYLLFTQLGLIANSEAVFVDQIQSQNLPRNMEEYWIAGDFEALHNMLRRVVDKVKTYWAVQEEETIKLTDNLSVVLSFLKDVRYAEDLLCEDAEKKDNEFSNFSNAVYRILQISGLKQNKWISSYLQDTAHLPPRYDLLVEKYKWAVQYISDVLIREENTELKLDFYLDILRFPWHNRSVANAFKSLIEDVVNDRIKQKESDAEDIQKRMPEITSRILELQEAGDKLDEVFNKTHKKFELDFPEKINAQQVQIKKLKAEIDTALISAKSEVEIRLSAFEEELRKAEKDHSGYKLHYEEELKKLQKDHSSYKLHYEEELKQLQKDHSSYKLHYEEELKKLQKDHSDYKLRYEEELEKLQKDQNDYRLRFGELSDEVATLFTIPFEIDKQLKNAEKNINEIKEKIHLLLEKPQTIYTEIEKIDEALRELSKKQEEVSFQSQGIENELYSSGEVYKTWAPRVDDLLNRIKDLSSKEKKISKQASEIPEKMKNVDEQKVAIDILSEKMQRAQASQSQIVNKADELNSGFSGLQSELKIIDQKIELSERNIKFLEDNYRNILNRHLAWKRKSQRLKKLLGARRSESRRRKFLLIVFGVMVFAFLALVLTGIILSSGFTFGNQLGTPSLPPISVQGTPVLLTTPSLEIYPSVTPSLGVPSVTPPVVATVPPTPEKFLVTIALTGKALKTSPFEDALYAQTVNGPMTIANQEQLFVIGKKNNSWLLLEYTDSKSVSWWGWSPVVWVQDINEDQIKSLPVKITCFTEDRGEQSLVDILSGGSPLDIEFRRLSVYEAIARYQDNGNTFLQLKTGFGDGWIQADILSCSDDISLLPEITR